MTARWGITIPLQGTPLPTQRETITALADLGYTDAWTSEVNGTDAFTPLALAAQWAPALRLGPAIVPVYTRGPALLAQQAATLAQLAPGRFVMGIGTSSPAIVQQWNGIPFDEPYLRARDTLRFLRRALAGEKVTEEYATFSVRGFKLDPILAAGPVAAPPIVLAALRPGMLRLAAREADGAITNWLSPQDVRTVRAAFGSSGDGAGAENTAGAGARTEDTAGTVDGARTEAGAADGGKSGDKELIARIFVCPTEDAGEARWLGRRLIAAYMTVPVYAAYQQWLGRGEVLAPLQEAWAAGDRKRALDVIPDEVVDDLIVHGSPERCRDRVREYVDNGLTTPVLAIVPVQGMSAVDAAHALAPSAD